MNREKLKAWVQASRPPFFVATLIPLTAGAVLAGRQGSFDFLHFFLVLFASFLVHFATNISNDYFDHMQGTDAGESIGGSRVLQEGKITVTELGQAIVLLYTVAALTGFYLVWTLKLWAILPLMALAFFSSLFYVAPPVKYGYHGLGEFFVAINMGPVMVMGSNWVILGRVDWTALPVSFPIGLMVALILYYQSLPDMETDRAVGKRTLAVRLGKSGARIFLVSFWIAIYTSIALLTLTGCFSRIAWYTLLTLPIPIKVWRLVVSTHDWVELDSYGKYIRIFYFVNGLILIAALF
ncbi:1,4-dihydroxy-2-naphthoate prenyltransferase [Syntrophus gentianae]|uniref:1,4-dihydroxy-2-naphthoate octaprenyltransferase n=1 Tax=Syntrophus gentianae TaxID=43775 RepID=A0A1H7VT19_9BACT|nr:1,4-dihydroxy-2-naphthoate octaprenyltransferase [Syntrophus gentianae]SEM12194.1 1,4-dihydroxy-2-naphthoate prenyltransferase [Syntrophus gentianae]